MDPIMAASLTKIAVNKGKEQIPPNAKRLKISHVSMKSSVSDDLDKCLSIFSDLASKSRKIDGENERELFLLKQTNIRLLKRAEEAEKIASEVEPLRKKADDMKRVLDAISPVMMAFGQAMDNVTKYSRSEAKECTICTEDWWSLARSGEVVQVFRCKSCEYVNKVCTGCNPGWRSTGAKCMGNNCQKEQVPMLSGSSTSLLAPELRSPVAAEPAATTMSLASSTPNDEIPLRGRSRHHLRMLSTMMSDDDMPIRRVRMSLPLRTTDALESRLFD